MTAGDHENPNFDAVVDWLEGRLDAKDTARVDDLVRSRDRETMAIVEWWNRFRAAAALPVEPVPDGLAARLRAMAPVTPERPAPDGGPWWGDRLAAVVRASLSFDSLREPGLAMARSASDATRQLVLSGPGLDIAIDVSISPSAARLSASAQLLPLADAEVADVRVQTWACVGLVSDRRSDSQGGLDLGRLPDDLVIIQVDRTPAWPAMCLELDLRQST